MDSRQLAPHPVDDELAGLLFLGVPPRIDTVSQQLNMACYTTSFTANLTQL